MTIEELEMKLTELDGLRAETNKRIEELNKQVAELKKQGEEKPKPPHPRWKPERDEPYYTIHVGCACAGLNTWDSDTLDGDIYSLGFVFKTEAETEFAIERLKVLAEMREWAGKWDDTFVLTYVGNDDFVQISSVLMSRNTFGEMRFTTKEDAKNCIKAVGKERLKKYYFLIPETK